MTEPSGGFPPQFDHRFLGLVAGTDKALFGLNVLRSLVDGITDYRRDHASRTPYRSLGPALLGAFMWGMTREVIQAVTDFPAACVVVSKQPAATAARAARTAGRYGAWVRFADAHLLNSWC